MTRAEMGDEARGSHPGHRRKPELRLNSHAELGCERQRLHMRRRFEERPIHPELLESIGRIAHQCAHLRCNGPVTLEARPTKDSTGTEGESLSRVHPLFDTETARLCTRAGHAAALARIATHDYRPPPQLVTVRLLDGRVEAWDMDEDDHAHHSLIASRV